MVTLRDLMAEDVTRVFLAEGEFAEEIVFRPRSTGIGQTILAIVDRDESLAVTISDDGASRIRQFAIWISITQDDGVVHPIEGDEVEIQGEKAGTIIMCRVRGRPQHDGLGMQRVDLVAHETREKSSREYRIDR